MVPLGILRKGEHDGIAQDKKREKLLSRREESTVPCGYMGVRVATITERNISLLSLRFGVRVIAGMDSLGAMRIPFFDTKETTGLYG